MLESGAQAEMHPLISLDTFGNLILFLAFFVPGASHGHWSSVIRKNKWPMTNNQ
jgi:hypothetical protein